MRTIPLEEWLWGIPWRREGRLLVPAYTLLDPPGFLIPLDVMDEYHNWLWSRRLVEITKRSILQRQIVAAECAGPSLRLLPGGKT